MLIHPLPETYRGFRLGYVQADGARCFATWKSSLEKRWIKSDAAVSKKYVVTYAQDMIDFQYLTEAAQFELGRKLTQEELAKLMEA